MGKAIKIEYFPSSYARPGPLIMLLEHKGASYEKIEVSQEAWGARKAAGNTGEFGGMPIVHQDGKTRQQTNALLRQLGIQFGYYDPSDWKKAGVIDMIVETYTDAFNSISGTIVFTPAEKKAEEMEAWRDGILTKLLTIVEKHLSMNPIDKFLTGDDLTIADFALASLTFNILKNELNPVH